MFLISKGFFQFEYRISNEKDSCQIMQIFGLTSEGHGHNLVVQSVPMDSRMFYGASLRNNLYHRITKGLAGGSSKYELTRRCQMSFCVCI